MTRSISNRALPALAAGGLFLFSLFSWSLLPAVYQPSLTLGPYLTVVTSLPHDQAADRLRNVGFSRVILPSTTYVLLSRIGRVDEVPVAALDQLLDPVDPRHDPFMQRTQEYFRIDGRNALYVAADSPLSAWRAVKQALGAQAQIAELDLAEGWIAAALVALAALCALGISGGRGLLRVVSFIPLAVPAFFFGLGAGVAAAFTGLAFDRFAAAVNFQRAVRDRELASTTAAQSFRLLWMIGVALFGLLYGGLLSGPYLSGTLALGLAGSVGVRFLFAVLSRPGLRDEEHRVFRPVPILKRPRLKSPHGRERVLALVAVLAVSFSAVLADRLVSAASAPRPVPAAVHGESFSYDSLAQLAASDRSNSLPDLSDYLAHRAFQEGFPYGAEYGFPSPDKPVVIDRFVLDDEGAFTSYPDEVLTFDQQWLETALREAPAGIVSLLRSLRAPAGVALARREALYSRYSRIVLHVLFLILTAIPFIVGSLSRARLIQGAGGAAMTGRSRQVA